MNAFLCFFPCFRNNFCRFSVWDLFSEYTRNAASNFWISFLCIAISLRFYFYYDLRKSHTPDETKSFSSLLQSLPGVFFTTFSSVYSSIHSRTAFLSVLYIRSSYFYHVLCSSPQYRKLPCLVKSAEKTFEV